jgi:four helix bundle protein
MTGVRRFEDLRCWQEARVFSITIENAITNSRCTDQDYISQLRRATVSIQTNIAEGFDRYTHNEFHRFLRIARASAGETRSLLAYASDRGWIDAARYKQLRNHAENVTTLITRLMRHLRDEKPKR